MNKLSDAGDIYRIGSWGWCLSVLTGIVESEDRRSIFDGGSRSLGAACSPHRLIALSLPLLTRRTFLVSDSFSLRIMIAQAR